MASFFCALSNLAAEDETAMAMTTQIPRTMNFPQRVDGNVPMRASTRWTLPSEKVFQNDERRRPLAANHRDAASSVGAIATAIAPSLRPCLTGFSRWAGHASF